MDAPTVEVCLTPDLIHQHDLHGKIVVVVDIFRATSCIVTGLAYGVASITPVMEVEECLELGKKGLIMAGERGGQKVEGFDIGNSPFEYQQEEFIDRHVALTTTNGTRAIQLSKMADRVLIGSFLNLSSTVRFISSQKKSVIVHCAGWKGTPNIEDTLYAGALVDNLDLSRSGDSTAMACELYLAHKQDLPAIAGKSGHAKRLNGFGVQKDIAYCMQKDVFSDLDICLKGDRLVKI